MGGKGEVNIKNQPKDGRGKVFDHSYPWQGGGRMSPLSMTAGANELR